MNGDGLIAVDTNLIRNTTPRRYITALEGLRGRRIAILPMVDRELRGQLRSQASKHIERRCRERGIENLRKINAATKAASRAVGEWWEEERVSNRSIFTHMPDLGEDSYGDLESSLPGIAFTDTNNGDRMIYAQAWAHNIEFVP